MKSDKNAERTTSYITQSAVRAISTISVRIKSTDNLTQQALE